MRFAVHLEGITPADTSEDDVRHLNAQTHPDFAILSTSPLDDPYLRAMVKHAKRLRTKPQLAELVARRTKEREALAAAHHLIWVVDLWVEADGGRQALTITEANVTQRLQQVTGTSWAVTQASATRRRWLGRSVTGERRGFRSDPGR